MKYVKLELNHTGKVYEYATDLDMEVGSTYRITKADGWTPPMRVKVLSESLKPEYDGVHTEILEVRPEEDF